MSNKPMPSAAWTCGGCGKSVNGPQAEDKTDRWCAECGAAYRTNFGRLEDRDGVSATPPDDHA